MEFRRVLFRSPGEPRFLGFHLAGGDVVLDDLEIAGLAHIGRPDRHARRHAEPLEHKLLPGLLVLPIRLHQTCRPPVAPARPQPVGPEARSPRSRCPTPAPRPASYVPLWTIREHPCLPSPRSPSLRIFPPVSTTLYLPPQ